MHEYILSVNWPETATKAKLGSPTGIGIDNNNQVHIFHRAGRQWLTKEILDSAPIADKTVLALNIGEGSINQSWGDHLFMMPHGLTIDHEQNIWLTDVQLHQVFKFHPTGRLLMALGTVNTPGDGAQHFNAPTDIAIANDGSIYVSDGYFNNRIVKFDRRGNFVSEWGAKGIREGQFNLPHALELDEDANLYVADRENNRIQIFTSDGVFREQWAHESQGKISSIAFDRKNNRFLAVDYTVSASDEITGSSIIVFSHSGEILDRSSRQEGLNCWYHNVIADHDGNIFVTDIMNDRILKFDRL